MYWASRQQSIDSSLNKNIRKKINFGAMATCGRTDYSVLVLETSFVLSQSNSYHPMTSYES